MKKFVLALAGFATAVGMVAAPSAAWAAPTPDSGPTSGGTTVTDNTVAGVTFTQVSAGAYHSLAVGSDGNTYAWGDNGDGQLGNGTTTTQSERPVLVQTPVGVTFTQVTAGYYHSLALGSDGNTYAWGYNGRGQLGDGTNSTRNVPVVVQLPSGVSVTQLAAGGFYSLALGSDGNTYGWGQNSDGEIGDGTSNHRNLPVLVTAPIGVAFTQIFAGINHSVAIGSDGKTYTWGINNRGQLGNGTTIDDSKVPLLVQTPPGLTFTEIAAHGDHTLAVGADGNTYAWGDNGVGQLGDGTTTGRNAPVLVQTPSGVTFTQIAAGDTHSMAQGSDGSTYAWGYNGFGELGDGTSTTRRIPVIVQTPAGIVFTQISGGFYHSLARDSVGSAYSWGYNQYGQLGDGTSATRRGPVPITGVTVTSVLFGGVAGTSLTQNGSEWSAVTPAGLCGPVDLVVESQQFGQTTTEEFTDGFTFGTAAAITTQPESGAVPAGGGEFTTAVAVSGDNAPTVQWQSSVTGSVPWTDIAGADSDSLTVPVTENTYVRAMVTNCFGSVASDSAKATVTAYDPVDPINPGGPATPGESGGLSSTGASANLLLVSAIALILAGGTTLLIRRIRKAK